MKRVLKITGLVIVLLIILSITACAISISFANDYSADKTAKEIKEIPLPENTEFVELISRAGKFTGNGNGMQYFGAMLIKSDLSLAELDEYYSAYRENEWDYVVEVQDSREVECIEHSHIWFSTDVEPSESYYIVYSWGSAVSSLGDFDLRGH